MARDIILREVPHYGWLPIITNDGKEEYRGEFRATTGEALEHAERALDQLEIQDMEAKTLQRPAYMDTFNDAIYPEGGNPRYGMREGFAESGGLD